MRLARLLLLLLALTAGLRAAGIGALMKEAEGEEAAEGDAKAKTEKSDKGEKKK